MLMSEKQDERNKLWIESLAELAEKKVLDGKGDKNFDKDWDKFTRHIFNPTVREFLDLSLGPIVFFPTKDGGNDGEDGNEVNDGDEGKRRPGRRKRRGRRFATLASQYFPIAHGSGYEAKRKIARCLFGVRVKKDVWLIPREASVLLGLGSTVFHVALELARELRNGVEANRTVLPNDNWNFGAGHWHTDSFETARLLGPLASPDWGPTVYLLNKDNVVSRKGHSEQDVRLNIPLVAEGKPREIQVVVAGCTCIDRHGAVFGGEFNDRKMIQSQLNEAADKVIFVATSDKLGRDGDRTNKFDLRRSRDREFYIVTDEKPKLTIPGFKIFSPEDVADEFMKPEES
jgi:hypothetical protein